MPANHAPDLVLQTWSKPERSRWLLDLPLDSGEGLRASLRSVVQSTASDYKSQSSALSTETAHSATLDPMYLSTDMIY